MMSGRFIDIECDSEKGINLSNTSLFRRLLRNGYAMGLVKSYYTIA